MTESTGKPGTKGADSRVLPPAWGLIFLQGPQGTEPPPQPGRLVLMSYCTETIIQEQTSMGFVCFLGFFCSGKDKSLENTNYSFKIESRLKRTPVCPF